MTTEEERKLNEQAYVSDVHEIVKPVAVLKDRTFYVRSKVFIQQFLFHRITTF